MAENTLYDYGYGSIWKDVYVTRREGYYTSVTDYHEHDFYEINLILSGNVKILTRKHFEEGVQNRIVLTRPHTPHYISCFPDTLYSRLYLVFTDSFIANYVPEWKSLSAVFGENGNILSLSPEETAFFADIITRIEQEDTVFGKRLLVLYLLHRIFRLVPGDSRSDNCPPAYIMDTISYIENNYRRKITVSFLANHMYIGRTKLMADFKKHTGNTLGEYITLCRLKNAICFLNDNQTLEYTAERCGFADSSGMIRAFKKHYGTTPYAYVKKKQQM